MSAARILLITAAVLALNACRRADDILVPPTPPATTASAAVATPPPAPAAAPAPTATMAAPQAASKAARPVAKAPAPLARAPTPASPPVVAKPAPLTLDLSALTARLRETKAIGLFTKISLKNKVDDLLDEFRDHYKGKDKPTLTELRQSYDLLMMKVLSLLQDADQQLASTIVASREAIWNLLADPVKFATLET